MNVPTAGQKRFVIVAATGMVGGIHPSLCARVPRRWTCDGYRAQKGEQSSSMRRTRSGGDHGETKRKPVFARAPVGKLAQNQDQRCGKFNSSRRKHKVPVKTSSALLRENQEVLIGKKS
jgi:hypothetical protein